MSLARSVKPAMSANSTEASSYLSAMMLRAGSFSRSATLAGKMLASNASDRSYSTSMASSARTISRTAYHTVATTITQAEMVVTTKLSDKDHAGWAPVSRGTRNCSAITSPEAMAARLPDKKIRLKTRCNTTREAEKRKYNCKPEPVPTNQQIAKIDT